jgi:hypothetical protein
MTRVLPGGNAMTHAWRGFGRRHAHSTITLLVKLGAVIELVRFPLRLVAWRVVKGCS